MQSILQDYSAASVQSVDLRKSEPYCPVPNTSREIRRRISSSHHIQMWVVRTGFLVFWRSFPDPNPKLLKLPKVFANGPHFFPLSLVGSATKNSENQLQAELSFKVHIVLVGNVSTRSESSFRLLWKHLM